MPRLKSRVGLADRVSASSWMAARRERGMRPPADVGPVIGARQHCWCGQPFGHDWPGKVLIHGFPAGAPHPRQGV